MICPNYIAEFNSILDEKYGLKCVHYAHAGAGEIHLRPILNLKTETGNSSFGRSLQDIADLVKKYRVRSAANTATVDCGPSFCNG